MTDTLTGAPVPISLYRGGELPPFQPGPLNFDYLLAGDGLHLRAQQDGLEAIVPVSTIRGLPILGPSIRWDVPPVPVVLVARMLEQARQARSASGQLLEILFYLTTQDAEWELHTPAQEQESGNVWARDGQQELFVRTRIEVHSHGALPPYFSATDNRWEGLLRIYAVLGQVETTPALRVRVGVYGYYLPIPAALVFDLAGSGIVDAWTQDLLGPEGAEREGEYGPLL